MLCKVIFAISDFLVFIKNINIDPSTTTEWTLSIQTNCSTVATQYAQKEHNSSNATSCRKNGCGVNECVKQKRIFEQTLKKFLRQWLRSDLRPLGTVCGGQAKEDNPDRRYGLRQWLGGSPQWLTFSLSNDHIWFPLPSALLQVRAQKRLSTVRLRRLQADSWLMLQTVCANNLDKPYKENYILDFFFKWVQQTIT